MSDPSLDSDSPELEALFDSIAQHTGEQGAAQNAPSLSDGAAAVIEASATEDEAGTGQMYEQIGQLTRKLHDTLQAMGYDKSLEKVADIIPDAKDRLSYIANLTASAADRVLNATDIAKPIQEQLEQQSTTLSARWDALLNNQLSIEEFKTLAHDTRTFLHAVPQQTQATNAQLLEIVMAQDFQDLTGQVIKKMMEMAKGMENELVSFLIAYSPTEKKIDLSPSLLNGPVISAEGRTDVVTNQQQVDDLLESLGF